jgi:hypothetical protein
MESSVTGYYFSSRRKLVKEGINMNQKWKNMIRGVHLKNLYEVSDGFVKKIEEL